MCKYSQREEKTIRLFHNGFNCAQSVLMAYSDLIDISEDSLSKIASPLGGGFSRTGGNCGAINAAVIAYSLIKGESNKDSSDKAAVYKIGQKMLKELAKINGSTNCTELSRNARNLSKDMPKEFDSIVLKPCTKFILDSINILDREIEEN